MIPVELLPSDEEDESNSYFLVKKSLDVITER